MKNIDKLISQLTESDRTAFLQFLADIQASFAPFRSETRKSICDTWASQNKTRFRAIIQENACFTAASTCRFMVMLIDNKHVVYMRMKTYRNNLAIEVYDRQRDWIETKNVDSINVFLKLFNKSVDDVIAASCDKTLPFVIDLAILCS